MAPPGTVAERVEQALWPQVHTLLDSWAVPGAALAVVHDTDRVATAGFGTRDLRYNDAPVTEHTLFHLASISKSFVATAALRLVQKGQLELEASVTSYLPDLVWADPRAGSLTVGQLLSHTGGMDDVTDYEWHRPDLGDDALARFAQRVAGRPFLHDPGTAFRYSNAGYELLGHLLATVTGQPFESHLKEHLLDPLGMTASTFLREQVPPDIGAVGHLGLPPRVLGGAPHPYTRRHAPSSTLHSSAAELGVWMAAHLSGSQGLLGTQAHATMWAPRTDVEDFGDLHAKMALGWFLGRHREHATVGHAGGDPGFQTNLTMLPDLGVGVAVLVNANTAPVFGLTALALDVLLGEEPELPPPPVTVQLGEVLAEHGVPTAIEHYRSAAAMDPPEVDLDEEGFEEGVWGAIEMHRGAEVADVLEVWRTVQPDSSAAWGMTGWAQKLAGETEAARASLERALELDEENEEARAQLRGL